VRSKNIKDDHAIPAMELDQDQISDIKIIDENYLKISDVRRQNKRSYEPEPRKPRMQKKSPSHITSLRKIKTYNKK
jgi:hypothetical protein